MKFEVRVFEAESRDSTFTWWLHVRSLALLALLALLHDKT
jgi:hypothetical protein